MAHYLFRGSYTPTGMQGVLKDGAASRRAVVEQMFQDLGGRLEVAYWAFGSDDFIIIGELPDNAAAAKAAMTVAAGGGSSATTTVLLTGEEVDEARKRSVSFRAPGA